MKTKSKESIFKIANKVFSFIDKKKYKQGYFLIVFTIIVSLVEVVGISLIMPFVQISIDFNSIHSNHYLEIVFQKLSFSSESSFVVVIGSLLIVFYVLRSFLNLLYY